MVDKERWILISDGTPHAMYSGKTSLSEEEIDTHISKNLPIEIKECRIVRTLIAANPGGGITQNEVVTPVGLARTGLRMKVVIKSYFWPDEDDATNFTFLDKIKAVEKSERAHRAQEAGIVTLDRMPPGAGGSLLS